MEALKSSPPCHSLARFFFSSSSHELPSKRLPASSQLPSPLAVQSVVTRQQMDGCCSVVCGLRARLCVWWSTWAFLKNLFRSMDFISMLSHVVLYFQAKSWLYLNVFYFIIYYYYYNYYYFLWLASPLPPQLLSNCRHSNVPVMKFFLWKRISLNTKTLSSILA